MRFVKADKPVKTTHKKFGEISVEVEVPELESIEEFVTFAGGESSALVFINNNVATSAKNGARVAMSKIPETDAWESTDKNAETGLTVQESWFEKLRKIVKDYTPQQSDGLSKAKKADAYDSIGAQLKAAKESGAELSMDQLLALWEASK